MNLHRPRANLMFRPLSILMLTAPLSTALLLASPWGAAFADVTTQEQVSLNVTIIKMHGTTKEEFTSDKKRADSDFRCDGFMSMLCGKNQGLEIVRLDRDVTWSGDAKKKQYTEVAFPTPEQRRAMEEHMKAAMEKLKSCPAPKATPASQGVDTSKCEMSPPKITVSKTDDAATIVGHSTHRTILNMTQSCKVKDSADVCDMSYTFDLWLTGDEMPELADRRAFDRNYLHKLGLDDAARGAAPEEFKKFLAPYADAMKELGSKTSDLKGYPLKTTFRVAVGGPHCSRSTPAQPAGGGSPTVAGSATDSAVAAGTSTAASQGSAGVSNAASQAAGSGVGGAIAGSAAGAFASKMIGGLFAKKNKPADAPATATPASSATPAPDAGLTPVAEFTVETTSLSSDPIPAAQFEMPADWKKVVPQHNDEMREVNCPTTGT